MDHNFLTNLLRHYRAHTEVDPATLEADVWQRIHAREALRGARISGWKPTPYTPGLQFAAAAFTLVLGFISGIQTSYGPDARIPDETLSIFSERSPYLLANFISRRP